MNEIIIPDGDNTPRSSENDGDVFVLNQGDSTTVDGQPVLTAGNDRVVFKNAGSASTTGETATVQLDGDRDAVKNFRSGEITSQQTAVQVNGTNATVNNAGEIAGAVNGVNFANGGQSSGLLLNQRGGVVSSDSRAVNIGGDGVVVANHGEILGTGDQRNGTIYADSSADNYAVLNARSGVIDAGTGNNGDGISFQVGDDVTGAIVNAGKIAGRGEPTGNIQSNGIRLFNGAEEGNATFNGRIFNSGTITSDSQTGAQAALSVQDGVNFRGNIINGGLIDGARNGLYFGDAEHDATVRNFGTIQSDSRAVNIDGSGVDLVNFGRILGTGDQRNGTVYSDATADDYSITNTRFGRIDAGDGYNGAGIALQTGEVVGDVVEASITNYGTIQGRGQGAADSGLAGDGLRIFAGASGDDRTDTTFSGDIYNGGKILSESAVGPTAAVRFSNGLAYDGTLTNARGGLIDGVNNGLYFGDAEHDATVRNFGTIQSDSRAVNIDGSGVDLVNSGRILGTGDQRNGTVYSDATADDYSITNTRFGRIDAGDGNNGAGIALQTGEVVGDVVEASITNYGTIQGRGQGAADSGLAGDGLRIFAGASGDGQTDTTFSGDIYNGGKILSESAVGPTAGVRFSNGLAYEGTLTNASGGLIDGVNNGLYFGVAEHDATVENYGTIQSDSRAVNIDGSGVTLNNYGRIIGTGDQRNGTIYSDATATSFEINNGRRGVVTLAEGAAGAAVSLQLASTVTASITNEGLLAGRGDAVGANPSAGVRLFSGVNGESVFQGDIDNDGEISSETSAGILIQQDVELQGEINNRGTIKGVVGIDASETSVGITVNQIDGEIEGDVLFGSGADSLVITGGTIDGEVYGGEGNDVLTGGRDDDVLFGDGGDDLLTGNRGDDILDGGAGDDQLFGGRGDDQLSGGADDDQLDGGRGADSLDGGAGEDVLTGGRGADRLDGGSENDQLTGGRGGDSFVFVQGTAADTVTDFGEGSDELDVSAFGFADAQAVLDLARQEGGNTVIDLDAGAGDQVTLIGVQLSDLDQNDLVI